MQMVNFNKARKLARKYFPEEEYTMRYMESSKQRLFSVLDDATGDFFGICIMDEGAKINQTENALALQLSMFAEDRNLWTKESEVITHV